MGGMPFKIEFHDQQGKKLAVEPLWGNTLESLVGRAERRLQRLGGDTSSVRLQAFIRKHNGWFPLPS